MLKKAMLMLLVMSMLLTAHFPAGASNVQAEGTRERDIPASFDLKSVDTDGDGVGDHCYVTPVRLQNPFGSRWAFAAIAALSAQNGEIHLSVADPSDTGVDGYEAQYRMKGSAEWDTASFEAGQTDPVISGLAAGEYEVQVCTFVGNTSAPAPEEFRAVACGSYGDIYSAIVP